MREVSLRGAWSAISRAVILELRLYRCLARWIARRPDHTGGVPFGYARLVTPVMWLWIFGSAVEVPIAHILIPWDGIRIAALTVGVWGVLWMVGFLASLNVYPHLFGDTGLRIRQGATVDITVPWSAIERFVVEPRNLPSSVRSLQRRDTDSGVNLQVAVSGEVNVHAKLRHPVTVPTHHEAEDIVELSFLVDDPRDFAEAARAKLSTDVAGER